MGYSTAELQADQDSFHGGSDGRYRHAFNSRFIFTEGVKSTADKAQAYWLLDLIALKVEPLYRIAWNSGKAGIGIVSLRVDRPSSPQAVLTLSIQDDAPDTVALDIETTDFPEGDWTFYLGTDQDENGGYLTTICLPQEY